MTRPAVFLDRDGVINTNVFYEDSGEWESPRAARDVALHSGAAEAIAQLNQAGQYVFIVSNQPSYAKGKIPLEALAEVHAKIVEELHKEGAVSEEYFYAYDHPQAIVTDIPGPKGARKPSPYFLQEAAKTYGLVLANCWMVGDRDSDIACGKNAGVRTIAIAPDHPNAKAGAIQPDYHAASLLEAVATIILKP